MYMPAGHHPSRGEVPGALSPSLGQPGSAAALHGFCSARAAQPFFISGQLAAAEAILCEIGKSWADGERRWQERAPNARLLATSFPLRLELLCGKQALAPISGVAASALAGG